jgi:rhodanese-related sulfurtransferase
MIRRITYIIFITLVSLAAAHGPYSRADEQGPGESAQKTVKVIESGEARVIIGEKKGSPGFVILDVRTEEEFSGGHIEDAVNIDVNSESFRDEVGKLDRSKTYIVHCRTGRRSETAVEAMEEMGFTDIFWMQDGIVGWQDAGFPVVK